MDKKSEITTSVPEPFLGPVFRPGVEPVIATGFNYRREEIDLHGVKKHGAIDMDVSRGTEILAAADGYYIATYGEKLMRNDDGSPRKLDMEQAHKANPHNKDLNPPEGEGPWDVYFGSFVVQGWHGNGRYTQYVHVDWVNPKIPYYRPQEVRDEEGNKTGDLKFSEMLRATVDEYRSIAVYIKAGEVIAVTGMTGCGWGKRCYDFAKFDSGKRPDFRDVNYTYYTEPHLHFVVTGRRAPYNRNARAFDPFGIYRQVNDGYPESRSEWSVKQKAAKHSPLWL
ncbi:MAG: hypothetical protein Q8P54_01570 [bacterium]|nr:hypothetical protein [bacterium]